MRKSGIDIERSYNKLRERHYVVKGITMTRQKKSLSSTYKDLTSLASKGHSTH